MFSVFLPRSVPAPPHTSRVRVPPQNLGASWQSQGARRSFQSPASPSEAPRATDQHAPSLPVTSFQCGPVSVSPGHAGKEGPQLARTGASQGFPRAAAPVGPTATADTPLQLLLDNVHQLAVHTHPLPFQSPCYPPHPTSLRHHRALN